MAEYIERENLIMDIQSRKLAEIVPNCNEPEIAEATYKQGQAIKKIITEYPAADVVEVVRCKDCKCCEHSYPSKAIGAEALLTEGGHTAYKKEYDYNLHSERNVKNPDKDITVLQMVICGDMEVMAELVYTRDYEAQEMVGDADG